MPLACGGAVVASADSDYELGFELYEILPDAILAVDQQGVIRYANRQAGRLFGQERAALVSTPVEALLPEHLRERHLAHRANYNLEPRRRPMGRGLDLVARRVDGSTFPVDIMLNPLKHLAEPMTLAVVRDMTDIRALEDALRQARAAFEKFYEQPPDGTIMVDDNGKIDRVNEAAEAMFGFSREHMIGRSIEMLIPERVRDRHITHRAHYMKDLKTRAMGANLELFAQRADGSEFPVDIMLSPMEIDQRRLVLAMVRDITERKRAEARVQWLMREVNHRAKNILSVVQAMAHQTRAGLHQEFVSEFEERIRGLSASYDLLVNNKWQNVPLVELVRAQLAHFGDLMNNRIALRGPDFWITSAAAQTIGMALHELATNAGKYGALSTDAGYVDIAWRLERSDDDGHRFTMKWSERGGPTVVTPTRHGFGWTVLCQMTKMLLGADVALEFAPAGVVWRLACPADRVRESEEPRQPKFAAHPVNARR
jgi:PAS domain S-box-containing protein